MYFTQKSIQRWFLLGFGTWTATVLYLYMPSCSKTATKSYQGKMVSFLRRFSQGGVEIIVNGKYTVESVVGKNISWCIILIQSHVYFTKAPLRKAVGSSKMARQQHPCQYTLYGQVGLCTNLKLRNGRHFRKGIHTSYHDAASSSWYSDITLYSVGRLTPSSIAIADFVVRHCKRCNSLS